MSDTIAAIATAPGRGAIGILRLSGDHAISIASALFRPVSGGSLQEAKDRQLIYGTLFDETSGILDQCLATISRAPHSYTGEDTAEFQCHGSPLLLSRALEAIFFKGARQAQPGEFTKRAFLNGRMDLTQAEAVIDLIDAQTEAAVHNAAGQLSGVIRDKIIAIYNGLLALTAGFQAFLDYPEEDILEPSQSQTESQLHDAVMELTRLSQSFQKGRLMTDGIPTVLMGRPNVGKSSLLNALLGYERAIVSDIPGTTRDTIEERVLLDGLLLRLIDTAGLRETKDPIEKLGLERAKASVERAQLALLVFDTAEPLTAEDEAVLDAAQIVPNVIAVCNKSDLPSVLDETKLQGRVSAICTVSAKENQGLSTLSAEIRRLFPPGSDSTEGEVLTNVRQADAVGRALSALRCALSDYQNGITLDAVLIGLEDALSALGEITGQTLREALLSQIFERFCVGK